jgi:hypothetical protein
MYSMNIHSKPTVYNCVYFGKKKLFSESSESIGFKGLDGGSGWTRTTDLTLIRGAL